MANGGLRRNGPRAGPKRAGRKMSARATGTAPKKRTKKRILNTGRRGCVPGFMKTARLASKATMYAKANRSRRFNSGLGIG